eukprot:GEMP01105462.1.p2 GENE.GEMP01105462.1~~GEMP01105462.1.p2  ORF type:complete len:106 (-),score=2.71 GEMP01105462.1:142-459(-)
MNVSVNYYIARVGGEGELFLGDQTFIRLDVTGVRLLARVASHSHASLWCAFYDFNIDGRVRALLALHAFAVLCANKMAHRELFLLVKHHRDQVKQPMQHKHLLQY